MPQYEVKKVRTDAENDSADGLSIITDSVVESGIVGDTYGFSRFDNLKTSTLKSLSGAEKEAAILTSAQSLVAIEYPNN